MKNSVSLLIIMSLSLFACQKESETTTLLGGGEVGLREAPRPFKGIVFEQQADQADVECDCEEDDLVFGSAGSGNLAHLGNVRSESRVCIENFILDGNGQIIGSNENGVCTRLTAANGDELIVQGDPHSLHFDPGCLCVKGSLTIHFAGGTGRFEHASGSGNLFISLDVRTGVYTEVYDGQISY